MPADVYALAELNIDSENVMKDLSECARSKSMELSKLYLSKNNICENVIPGLQDLRNKTHQYLISTSILNPDDFKPLAENLFTPLFVQILFDEFAARDIFTVKEKSHNLGLCTGFINIGVCGPTELVRPKLSEYEYKLLRLFAYIPVSSCHLGFNPEDLINALDKAMEAQGFYENNRFSALFITNGVIQYASGNAAQSLIILNELTRRMDQIRKDLANDC